MLIACLEINIFEVVFCSFVNLPSPPLTPQRIHVIYNSLFATVYLQSLELTFIYYSSFLEFPCPFFVVTHCAL